MKVFLMLELRKGRGQSHKIVRIVMHSDIIYLFIYLFIKTFTMGEMKINDYIKSYTYFKT
jgi:hypothetical protein